MIRRLFLLSFLLIGVLFLSTEVNAGFGISPPYIKTKNPIYPGSHYEQKVTLLRSSAEEALTAKILIDAPEIASWISIEQGEEFDLPIGSLRVPMIVTVDVPSDAEIGRYTGNINIRILPKGGKGSGVAIALGARLEVDLEVSDEEFLDFLVRKVDIPDFEVLKKPWSWKIFSYFFYRVKVTMNLENTGNVDIAPSKVYLEIFDIGKKKLIESHVEEKLTKIEPFQTELITASFPTNLEVGQYWGKVKIYKEDKIIHKDEISFTVARNGEIKTNLGIWPWVMLAGIGLIVLLIVLILVKIKVWKYVYKVIYILLFPIRWILRQILKLFRNIKIKIWKWLYKKASKYKDIDNKKE